MAVDRIALQMEFDREEAKGEITVKKGAYGAEVHVNGEFIAMVDLCPQQEQTSQLVCYDGDKEEPQVILKYDEQGNLQGVNYEQ